MRWVYRRRTGWRIGKWMFGFERRGYTLPVGWPIVYRDPCASGECPECAPYPPNTLCVCGDLIHPDQPFVEVEADGGLFHWNAEGGGHRSA